MGSLKKQLKRKKYIHIPIKITDTNHFEIKAKINGVPGRFILDTGASNTCVGTDKKEFFKLETKESKIKAAGAGATDMATQVSKNNNITIGKWVKNKCKIVVFDLVHVNDALIAHQSLPVDGIIGADILKKGKAIIDYKSQSLFLK